MQPQFHQMIQQFPNGVGLNPQKIGQQSSQQPQTFVSSSQHGRIMNQQQQYPIPSQSATGGNNSHSPYPQAQSQKQQQIQQQGTQPSAQQQQQQQSIHQSHQIGYIQKKVIQGYSYCLTDLIGKGYSSQVFRGKNDSTDEVVAIKVIDMKGITNEVQSFLLKNEINVLNKLNSNINCLKLFDVFQTANNTYIITEFCDHGDLKDLINKYGVFSERHAVRILKNILNGMTEMQNKGIIHRDMKLANILVRDGIPKIADFGFSKDLNSEPCKIYYNVGTPMYMSPQSLTKNEYSFKSDIWAVGVLFFEMMFGCTPWTADTEQQLVDKMQTIPVSFPNIPIIAEDTKDFIRRCLEVDEHNRLSLSEMAIHPVFNLLEKKDQNQQQHNNNTNNNSNAQKLAKGDKTPDNKNKENMTAHPAIIQGQKNWEGNTAAAAGTGSTPPGNINTGAAQAGRNKVMQEKIVQGQQQPQQQQQQYIQGPGGAISNTGKTPATPSHKEQSNNFVKSSSLASQNSNNNINTSSHNLQNQQPSQQQQQLQPSRNINQQESHTPQQQQLSQSQQNAQVSRDPMELFSANDQVILAQINFCRFLYRLHKLCIETRAIMTDGLQEKLAFLIMKNIMIKLQRLTQMADQKINHFNMPDFNTYIHEESFSRFQIVIREYQAKYSAAFNRLWESLVQRRDVLIADAKFSTVFDSQFSELETFYIILQGYLRQSAHELYSPLIGSFSYLESNQQLPQENQEPVVFLDYLITYYQLSQIILEHFNEFNHFAKVTKIESIAEGKPVLLSKFHFNSISNKILTLKM